GRSAARRGHRGAVSPRRLQRGRAHRAGGPAPPHHRRRPQRGEGGGVRRHARPRGSPTTEGAAMNKALVQVLGAVAYGELKAYEGAKADAERATDPAVRRRFRKVAAEELRHHKGFVSRLQAMGADPARAMRPYK